MGAEPSVYKYGDKLLTAKQLFHLDECEVSLGALYEHLKCGMAAVQAIKKQKNSELYFYDNRWQTARELERYPECIVGLPTLRYRLNTKKDSMTVYECMTTKTQQGKPLTNSPIPPSFNPLAIKWA